MGNLSQAYPQRMSVRYCAVAEDAPQYESEDEPSGSTDRFAHGCSLRLASALVEGTRKSMQERVTSRNRLRSLVARATGRHDSVKALLDIDALRRRLKQLARETDRNLAEQLTLLVQFEESEQYLADGCRNMIVWMDAHLGVGRVAAFERLRVGRALAELPVLESLFALGQISFSQLREITRYATSCTDAEFAVAALELSVSETIDYCRRFRHESDRDEDTAAGDAAEATASLRAFERRALRFSDIDAHSTRITIELPNDLAAEFRRSLEQVEDWLQEGGEGAPINEPTAAVTPTQRRADAAVLMSRRSLAHAGEAVAMADRYRVHVSVDARLLGHGAGVDVEDIPVERPLLHGVGPISTATARRLAADSGFTLFATDADGQIVGSSRKAPVFTRRQLEALRARDRCCQMPGCSETRHLHGHHVVHRENGGASSLDNAVMVCSSCHRLLHEGGFCLEAIGPNGFLPGLVSTKLLDLRKVDASVRERARAKWARVRRFRLRGSDGREYGNVQETAKVFTRVNSEVSCRMEITCERAKAHAE